MDLMALGEGEGARGTHPSLEPSAASQALLASLPCLRPSWASRASERGLCTLLLGCSCSSCLHGWPLLTLQVSNQMPPPLPGERRGRGLPSSPPPAPLSILPPYLVPETISCLILRVCLSLLGWSSSPECLVRSTFCDAWGTIPPLGFSALPPTSPSRAPLPHPGLLLTLITSCFSSQGSAGSTGPTSSDLCCTLRDFFCPLYLSFS